MRIKAFAFLFVTFWSSNNSKSQSIDESTQFLSQFSDLQLAEASQRNSQSYGRWDRIADENKILSNNYRTIATAVGFSANIYKDRGTGETKLLYRGTDFNSASEASKDWISANAPQFLGMPTIQHNILSPIVARIAKSEYNVSSCVGYSLGGANAAIGCSTQSLPTTTANSARLNYFNATITKSSIITNYRTTADKVSGVLGYTLLGKTVEVNGSAGGVMHQHDIKTLIEALRPRAIEVERSALTQKSDESKKLATVQPYDLRRFGIGAETGAPPSVYGSREIGLPESEKRRLAEEQRQREEAAQRAAEQRQKAEEMQRMAAAQALQSQQSIQSENSRWGLVSANYSGGGANYSNTWPNECDVHLPARGWAQELVRQAEETGSIKCRISGGREINQSTVVDIQYDCRDISAPPPDPNRVNWCALFDGPCEAGGATKASVFKTETTLRLTSPVSQSIYGRCTLDGRPYSSDEIQSRRPPTNAVGPSTAAGDQRASSAQDQPQLPRPMPRQPSPIEPTGCNQIGASRPAYCPSAGLRLDDAPSSGAPRIGAD